MTTVDQTTTNTVTVTGTPSDPGGTHLCPESPCDVNASDRAVVAVVQSATITVVRQVLGGRDATFDYTGSLGAFSLATSGGSASQTFGGLAPGTFTVTEAQTQGWTLRSLTCSDSTHNTSTSGSTAVIHVAEGETVVCTYTNQPVATPSGPGTDAVPPTSVQLPAALDQTGQVALIVGLSVVATALLAYAVQGSRRGRRRPVSR